MADVHAAVPHVSSSHSDRGALVEERQEGGDRRPPQFRIQSGCALTYMNANFRRNLSGTLKRR
jgi:hypothetical protein